MCGKREHSKEVLRTHQMHCKKPRKRRRAISVKGGGYRTGSRTPVTFTVLDAIPVSNPYTNNNTNNAQLDFMNSHAVPAVANATIAEPCARTEYKHSL